MIGKADSGNPTSNELAVERTRLASVRTEFALMRTGFAVSSFGAGIAEFLGRDNWPDWATDFLTATFVVVGMIFVQVGLNRLQASMKALGSYTYKSSYTERTLRFLPWVLQFSLLSLLIFILVH